MRSRKTAIANRGSFDSFSVEMSNALPNPSGDLFRLELEMLETGKKASRESPRRRMIMPIQRSQDARVQRLLNFLQPGTYIRPHRHPLPHATESLCLLEGELEFLVFSESGEILDRIPLTPENPLLDFEPGVWHGMIVKKPDTVIFEIKLGPYNPATDKEFAAWSPEEESPEVSAFFAKL